MKIREIEEQNGRIWMEDFRRKNNDRIRTYRGYAD